MVWQRGQGGQGTGVEIEMRFPVPKCPKEDDMMCLSEEIGLRRWAPPTSLWGWHWAEGSVLHKWLVRGYGASRSKGCG